MAQVLEESKAKTTMVFTNRSKVIIGITLGLIVIIVPSSIVWYHVSSSSTQCRMYDFLVNSEEVETSLFLTPFIKHKQTGEGQARAFVPNWRGVHSYSGFITVNDTSNSNLFFWFFPNLNKSAPLILYLQGGPGMSSMFGLFIEIGPFYVDSSHLNIERREFAWTATHSVLFVDSPVDTGFSYTDDKSTRAKDQGDVSRDLYEFLIQFFTLFPDQRRNEFYIAGTSYAGKYIPTLAYKIHQQNELKSQVHINLKGLAIGGGFFEAEIQDKFSDYNYHLGFIDEQQWVIGKETEAKIAELVKNEEFADARQETISLKLDIWTKWAGWLNILSGNALEMNSPSTFQSFQIFLTSGCVKGGLHIEKEANYDPLNVDVRASFDKRDYFYSTRPELEALLEADYRILFFASQFDMVVLHVGIARFLDSLNWKRSDEYLGADRKIWRVQNGSSLTIAGYVKEVKGMTYLLIRNSGHMPCFDNPIWCFDMISRFTAGRSFSPD